MEFGEKIYSSQTNTLYEVLQPVKAGGQAEVGYAISNKSTRVYFIKRLLNIKYSDKGFVRERCRIFERERREIYKKLNNKSLPGGTCSYIYDFFREKTFYYVVTEKADGISLNTKSIFNALSIDARLRLFKRIAYSFYPFEQGNIIHGDVKPDNVLVKNIEDSITARLVDFESAFFTSEPPPKGYVVGTEPYYSPELALYNSETNDVGKEVLTTKSDIFSLGIVLYELLTGHYPISADKKKYCYEVVSQNGNCDDFDMPDYWSSELRELLFDMLSLNPLNRPGIMDIVNRLSLITDTSAAINELHPIKTIVTRISYNQARVTLFSYNTNAVIYFSTDREEMKLYKEPFLISDDDIETKFEVSAKFGSKVISKTFIDNLSVNANRPLRASRPTIDISSNVVSLFCPTEGAKIYYTTDGSIPNKYSQEYVGSFTVGENVPIKAISRCFGMMSSDVVSKNSSSKVRIS